MKKWSEVRFVGNTVETVRQDKRLAIGQLDLLDQAGKAAVVLGRGFCFGWR